MFVVVGTVTTCGWLTLPDLALEQRVRLAAISLLGPLPAFAVPGFVFLETLLVIVLVTAPIAIAAWKPELMLARWFGYLAVIGWVLMGCAIAGLGF